MTVTYIMFNFPLIRHRETFIEFFIRSSKRVRIFELQQVHISVPVSTRRCDDSIAFLNCRNYVLKNEMKTNFIRIVSNIDAIKLEKHEVNLH